MYAWIWRRLPGGTASKTVTALLAIAAICALLLFVVFPWIVPYLPLNGVTISR